MTEIARNLRPSALVKNKEGQKNVALAHGKLLAVTELGLD